MFILVPNVLATSETEEGEIIIDVDEESKYVYPGEDAVFTWYFKNDDPFFTYEIFIECSEEERSVFVPESITLSPGEGNEMIQIYNTIDLLPIQTVYLHQVCNGIKYGPIGIVEVQEEIGSMDISINIIENNTSGNNTSNFQDPDEYSRLPINSLIIISIILIAIPLIGYFIKKRVKIEKQNIIN